KPTTTPRARTPRPTRTTVLPPDQAGPRVGRRWGVTRGPTAKASAGLSAAEGKTSTTGGGGAAGAVWAGRAGAKGDGGGASGFAGGAAGRNWKVVPQRGQVSAVAPRTSACANSWAQVGFGQGRPFAMGEFRARRGWSRFSPLQFTVFA